jgi:hypothetical protein
MNEIQIPPIPDPRNFTMNCSLGEMRLDIIYSPLRGRNGQSDQARFFISLLDNRNPAIPPIPVCGTPFKTEDEAWAGAEKGFKGWYREVIETGLLRELSEEAYRRRG